jgi:hypothetical protein
MIFQRQNSFLEIKYAYTIAQTLGWLLASSKGLKADYKMAAGWLLARTWSPRGRL